MKHANVEVEDSQGDSEYENTRGQCAEDVGWEDRKSL